MSDPTTDGLEATPDEIEGMVRNLCAYALGEPDPIQRYESLTHQQVLFEGMVDAIRRERGRMVADLVVAGLSVTEVAAQTSLSTVVKVRKLISLAGQTPRVQEATAARKQAERQLHDAAPPSPLEQPQPEPQEEPEAREEPEPEAREEPEPEAREEPERAAMRLLELEVRPLLEPEPLPLHLAAPAGTRLLTPEDLAALGLPVKG